MWHVGSISEIDGKSNCSQDPWSRSVVIGGAFWANPGDVEDDAFCQAAVWNRSWEASSPSRSPWRPACWRKISQLATSEPQWDGENSPTEKKCSRNHNVNSFKSSTDDSQSTVQHSTQICHHLPPHPHCATELQIVQPQREATALHQASPWRWNWCQGNDHGNEVPYLSAHWAPGKDLCLENSLRSQSSAFASLTMPDFLCPVLV